MSKLYELMILCRSMEEVKVGGEKKIKKMAVPAKPVEQKNAKKSKEVR